MSSIRGSMTALVTPFSNGAFDEGAYRDLIEFQIASGTDGVVPCGTTGESATLSHEEHDRVVEACVKFVAGRVPVIAGAGSNSTAEALRLTRHARDVGADAALLITPYYNRPTQEGLYRHYMAVAEEVDIPLVVYNVPTRTGCDILPETLARLVSPIEGHPNVVAVKEATGSLKRACDIRVACGERLAIISGDDFTFLPLLEVGGEGVISVVSNVVPGDMAAIYDAFMAGDHVRAREIHYRIYPLMNAMFIETNPIPAKTALAMIGRIREELRLPLVGMSDKNREALRKPLAALGLVGRDKP
jgi:4-hydroxy-tetrahydrodipicolinate synthase